MIQIENSIIVETQILLRFANGWTAAIAPNADGSAALAAWASHDATPLPGTMKAKGAHDGHPADQIAEFLMQISSQPEV